MATTFHTSAAPPCKQAKRSPPPPLPESLLRPPTLLGNGKVAVRDFGLSPILIEEPDDDVKGATPSVPLPDMPVAAVDKLYTVTGICEFPSIGGCKPVGLRKLVLWQDEQVALAHLKGIKNMAYHRFGKFAVRAGHKAVDELMCMVEDELITTDDLGRAVVVVEDWCECDCFSALHCTCHDLADEE